MDTNKIKDTLKVKFKILQTKKTKKTLSTSAEYQVIIYN